MKLVLKGGQVHIFDDKKSQYVRVNRRNVVRALDTARALPKDYEFKTMAQLLSPLEFDNDGELVA